MTAPKNPRRRYQLNRAGKDAVRARTLVPVPVTEVKEAVLMRVAPETVNQPSVRLDVRKAQEKLDKWARQEVTQILADSSLKDRPAPEPDPDFDPQAWAVKALDQIIATTTLMPIQPVDLLDQLVADPRLIVPRDASAMGLGDVEFEPIEANPIATALATELIAKRKPTPRPRRAQKITVTPEKEAS